MSSMTTKFMLTLLFTYIGGGAFMQIPQVTEFIELDQVSSFVYYTVFGTSVLLYVLKKLLELYAQWLEIRRKDRDS